LAPIANAITSPDDHADGEHDGEEGTTSRCFDNGMIVFERAIYHRASNFGHQMRAAQRQRICC
jgi:hypothetical protein